MMMMMMSALTIMMTFVVVLLCTSISTFAISAADADTTTKEQQQQKTSSTSNVAFQHSLDGGKTWIERGRIDMESFEFEPTSDNNNKWTKEQLDQLRALALKRVNSPTTTTTSSSNAATAAATSVASTSLLVRIIDVATSEVHTSLAVSPCALIVPRQYTSQLTYIAERYGITVGTGGSGTTPTTINSLRLMNPFHDEVCEPSVFKVKDTRSGSSNSDLVKLKISFVKSPQLKNIAFPYGSSSSNTIEDTGANLHDGAAGRRGRVNTNTNNKNSNNDENNNNKDGQQPPAEEKSFWEKYGTYIMIFFAVQTLGGLFGPKQQQQQQGGRKQKAE